MARTAGFSAAFGAALGVAVVAASGAIPARAEDYPACAKFDNPLAYNRCLAEHGPAAHETKGIAVPPDADRLPNARAVPGRPRFGSALQVSRTRHGRMVLELSVDAAPRAHWQRRRPHR